MSFLQGLGGGLGNGQSYSNATKTMEQEKSKEGVHAVSPHCFCSTNHTIFFSAGETEAQGKESNFSKNAEQSNVKCPSLEVGKAWDSCFMSLPWYPSLSQEREGGRQSIFLAQMLGDSTGPLLSGRKTTALNRPDNALSSTLNLRVLPDRSGVGRF